MLQLAEIVVTVSTAYLSIGVAVAVAFVRWGVVTVDPAARGSSILFRVLLTPASTVLWPWIIIRWREAAIRGNQT